MLNPLESNFKSISPHHDYTFSFTPIGAAKMDSSVTVIATVGITSISLLLQGIIAAYGSTSLIPSYIACGVAVTGFAKEWKLQKEIKKLEIEEKDYSDRMQPRDFSGREIRKVGYEEEYKKRQEHAEYYARTGHLPNGLELTKKERCDYKARLNTLMNEEQWECKMRLLEIKNNTQQREQERGS